MYHFDNDFDKNEFEMTQLLVERGANVNQHNNIDGSTPLHWACLYSKEKLIKCLIDNGADINALDWKNRTPLMYYLVLLGVKTNSRKDNELKKETLRFLLEFTDLTSYEFNCKELR